MKGRKRQEKGTNMLPPYGRVEMREWLCRVVTRERPQDSRA